MNFSAPPEPFGVMRLAWPDAVAGRFATPAAWSAEPRSRTCEQVWLDIPQDSNALMIWFPGEHYRALSRVTPADFPLAPGTLGEGISCEGIFEDTVFVGDLLQVGDCRMEIRGPALDVRLSLDFEPLCSLRHAMAEQGWCGWVCRVLEPGLVEPGCPVTRLEKGPGESPIRRLFLGNLPQIDSDFY